MFKLPSLDLKPVTRFVGKAVVKVKKYSPEILMVVGTGSVVAGAIMAGKGTIKAADILLEYEHNKDMIDTCTNEHADTYSEEDRKKDVINNTAVLCKGLVRSYWPAATLTIAGFACYFSAFGILKKRNAALVLAYNALEKTFADYRGRVKDELGEEADKRFYFGADEVKKETAEDGSEIKSLTGSGVQPSIYARWFDETSTEWTKSPQANKLLLLSRQTFAQQKLEEKGTLLLNDVYAMLGLPEDPIGALVGWVWTRENPTYVDFGIWEVSNQGAREFVNGLEKVILLDFNVTGIVYDKIGK